MYGKPTAWINVAAPGGARVPKSLWPACSATSGRPSSRRHAWRITLPRQAVGPDGLVGDPGFRAEAARVLDGIVSAVS